MARVRRAGAAALVLIMLLGTVVVGATPGRQLVAAVGGPPRPLAAVGWPVSGSILLAEVVTGGASASDEYVEVTNSSMATLDLGGLELVYVTSSGSTITRKATWTSPRSLDPGRHLLVANASGTYAAGADATYSGGFAATGGALAIRPIGGTAIDAIGWGDATNAFIEGSAAPAPPAGSSLERRPGGAGGNVSDTNDNAGDWQVQPSPLPQNLTSAPVPALSPTPGPSASSTPTPSSTVTPSPTPTATPSPIASPSATPGPTSTPGPTPSPTTTPTATPSPIDSPSPAPSPTPTRTPDATPTPSPTPIPTPSPSSTPTPTPTVTPIAAARSLPSGAQVAIEGVVTVGLGALESGRTGFVQDASGGIAIYLGAVAVAVLPAGSVVRVTGTVDERYAQRTIRADAIDIVILGGTSLPLPLEIATGAVSELAEGLRVTVAGTIVEAPSAYADGLGLLVDDGSGPIRAIVAPAALGGFDPHRGDLITASGVVGQRDSSGTGSEGYRVLATEPGELAVSPAPTPTPTASSTLSPTASSSPSPGATPSPTPSATPTPTPTPTPTASPTSSATPTPSPSPMPSPSPSPAPTSPPIATIRRLPVGSTITVDGVVTAEAGRAGGGALIALGDGSGGLFLKLPTGVAGPVRGSHLIVTGVLADPYGQLEVRAAIGAVVPAAFLAPPSPTVIGAAALAEPVEGRLAILTGTVEHAPTKTTGGGLAAWIVDDAGDRARIQVAAGSGIGLADLTVGHRYRLTGIVGQRASRKGALDGYRLWLRDRADIVHLAGPIPSPSPSPSPSPDPSGGDAGLVSIGRALELGGRGVTVLGVVTIPAGLLDTTGRRIVIQDGTAAIEVRLPTGAAAPAPGHRVRVTGTVGRAYDAPRIRATAVSDLGSGTLPAARALSRAPTVALEWRLVRVSGIVVGVHKLGDRWRAEIRVGAIRVPVTGLPGARIPSTALLEGRRATIVGIVRRAYPGAADRRYSVVPRSVADIAVASAADSGTSRTGAASGAGPDPNPSGTPGKPGTDPATSGIPTAELSSLADRIGSRVRVGGLVVDLTADGFTLDDGSATGQVVLTGEAAAFNGLIEPGDAVEAIGTVEADGPDTTRLVVAAAADLVRVGDPGSAPPSSAPSVDPPAGDQTDSGQGTAIRPAARAAGLGGFPDPTVVGAGWLALVAALSIIVTLVRRRRARRGLAARIAARLAEVAGPRPIP